MRHVIIGNGVAAISAAETIQALDPAAAVTLLSREDGPPYCRPMISLALQGTASFDDLPIRPPTYYQDRGFTFLGGSTAVELDLDRQRVRTSRGEDLPYDRLLLASGADPRPLKAPGADLPGVFAMRDAADVRGMLEALPAAKQALVLGGGLVGFKAAYGLLHRGLKVTMLIASSHPLVMQVDPRAGALIRDELEKNGLEVRVGVEVTALEAVRSRVALARLSDGGSLATDLVVVGKGVSPAISYLDRERIKVDLGVVVDEHLQTTAPGVYAAGDLAEHTDVARQRPWVNAIWPVAVEQGRLAGANMAGRPVAYRGSLGRNVIRVFGRDVLTAGLVNPAADDICQTLEDEDPRRGWYRRLVFQGDTLVGLALVGGIEQGGVLMNLIQSRLPVSGDKARLLEPGFNFASLGA
ncbi:MAG: FAD-dependent oxidoreductase [Deltaproteobacteria bacterium]|nr:FAD-dependent oxidoreductase [Deltaproteobacteria bacterium]